MRLRPVVLALAAGASIVGAGLCLLGVPVPGLQLLIAGLVTCAAIGFERWRYRGTPASGVATWQKTAERFEDPETGRILDVEFDPRTGNRRYVSSEDANSV